MDVPEYKIQTGTEPGEYGWTIKSTVRIQTKWNEHTTAPTSAQDMNDALDTMQGTLDFLGFLPLFGSAADAINTAMSILRADYLAALLNSVGLMGGIYSNVITAPFKMLLAAADNADKFSAALKTFKAAVGIVGDATSYISNMFVTMKNMILNVTSNISEVTKASAFGLLSKEMKDKLAGFLEMIGTGISKAMTAIQAQVDELTGKVKVAEADNLVDAMLKSDSAKLWGIGADGTNQGIKHFNQYWIDEPSRMESLASRLGVDVNFIPNTAEGFNNFTKLAENIVKNSTNVRTVGEKSMYFVEGAANANKGVAVILFEGKIQSVMPTSPTDFLNLK